MCVYVYVQCVSVCMHSVCVDCACSVSEACVSVVRVYVGCACLCACMCVCGTFVRVCMRACIHICILCVCAWGHVCEHLCECMCMLCVFCMSPCLCCVCVVCGVHMCVLCVRVVCVLCVRGLPPNIRNPTQRLGDNEVQSYQSGNILCLAWRAPQRKSAVIMLSSEPSLQMVTVHPQMPHRNEVTMPAVVDRYNHNINGVDVADQLTMFYSIQRKTRKWWRKLFLWMLETTIVNSYIVYKSKVPSATTHLGYRRSILNSLASDYIATAPPRPRIGRPRVTAQDPERLNGRLHILGKREQQ